MSSDQIQMLFTGAYGLTLAFYFLCLAVLWTFLPFAIFGIKKRVDTVIRRVDTLIAEVSETNRILRAAHTLPESKGNPAHLPA